MKAVRSGAKYGAVAGLIATWSISTAIAASEFELGLPLSTFYAVIGMSLGYSDFYQAAYLGFGLHLLTGTILGTIFGFIAARFDVKTLFNPYRSAVMGMITGIGVWLVFFLPLTIVVVQPSIVRISGLLTQSFPEQSAIFSGTVQIVWGIALSAAAFHLAWGAIFGYMTSSLMRIRAFRMANSKEGVGQ
jgi:hypothetical protein